MHCNAKYGRTGNKQENYVMKTGLSHRTFPLTGKNSTYYAFITGFCCLFPVLHVGHCSVTRLEIWSTLVTPSNVFLLMKTENRHFTSNREQGMKKLMKHSVPLFVYFCTHNQALLNKVGYNSQVFYHFNIREKGQKTTDLECFFYSLLLCNLRSFKQYLGRL